MRLAWENRKKKKSKTTNVKVSGSNNNSRKVRSVMNPSLEIPMIASAQLLDQETIALLKPYGTTNHLSGDELLCKVHLFCGVSTWQWWPIEYDPSDGTMYGLVQGQFVESGNFNINEIKQLSSEYPMYRNTEWKEMSMNGVRKWLAEFGWTM